MWQIISSFYHNHNRNPQPHNNFPLTTHYELLFSFPNATFADRAVESVFFCSLMVFFELFLCFVLFCFALLCLYFPHWRKFVCVYVFAHTANLLLLLFSLPHTYRFIHCDGGVRIWFCLPSVFVDCLSFIFYFSFSLVFMFFFLLLFFLSIVALSTIPSALNRKFSYFSIIYQINEFEGFGALCVFLCACNLLRW